MIITTPRMQLVPATPALLRAAVTGRSELAAALGVAVPGTWPPRFLDREALEFVIDRLREGPAQDGWWMYFMILPDGGGGRTLIGTAGYKGPVSAEGTVELGYGVVSEHQRRGYASEAVMALVARAFGVPQVRRVTAETLPELTPSIGVLRKCGFSPAGAGAEPGVIRFALAREAFDAGHHATGE